MALEVDVPAPPDLTNRGVPEEFEAFEMQGSESELRRQEIEAILRDGAWQEAFSEWAEYTDLSTDEYRVLDDVSVCQEFDFYWDPEDEQLRYTTPPLPADWRSHTDHADELEAEDFVDRAADELDDLGATVLEELEEVYTDWSGEAEDVVWDVETFGHGVKEEQEQELEGESEQ